MVGMFNRQSTVHLEDNGDNVSIDSNGRADEPQPTPPVKGVASRPTNQTLSLLPPPVKGVASRPTNQTLSLLPPPVKGVASRPTNQTLPLPPPPVKGVATRKVQQPAQQNVNRQAPVPLEDNGDNVSIDSNGRADDPRSMQPAQQNANKQTPAQYERMESISQAGLEPARNCCAIL